MGTDDKHVRLTEDAYEALERCIRADETVSEAVERLAGERPISDLAGLFTDAEVADIRTARTKRSETDAARRERE